MSNNVAKVRVRIVVEVAVTDAWALDATVGQVKRQGIKSAEERLKGLLLSDPRCRVAEIATCEVVLDCKGET